MQQLILGTVHKNGSSYAIVIPKPICRALDIKRGDQLVFSVTVGRGMWLHKPKDAAIRAVIKY